jgi:chemotaxis protein MotB
MLSATRTVRRALHAAAAALMVAGLGLGGCVGQQSHDQLLDANRSLTERNQELQRSNQELTVENGQFQKQRAAHEGALAELNRQNEMLKRKLKDAGLSIDDMMDRMGKLSMTPLDAETDKLLTALAEQYPDIVKYDSSRGMLRFASDLTFSSGSDAVQESAKNSLMALGKILGSAAAGRYEVMIMGHTDAQRISSGTAKNHPTNVHLSAHRAIAVRRALESMGVPADKMFVAGWGEFKPVAANGPKGECAANRRVEIFLTRGSNSMSNENEAAPEKPAAAARTGKSSKPTAGHDSRFPDLTK